MGKGTQPRKEVMDDPYPGAADSGGDAAGDGANIQCGLSAVADPQPQQRAQAPGQSVQAVAANPPAFELCRFDSCPAH